MGDPGGRAGPARGREGGRLGRGELAEESWRAEGFTGAGHRGLSTGAGAIVWRARILSMTNTLTATLRTNQGTVQVRLFPDQAPKTVQNFVELAEGSREWTDPRTRQPTAGQALRRDDLPPRDPQVHDPGRGPAGHRDRRARLQVRRRDPSRPAGSTGRTCWPWPTPAPAPTARSSSSRWCRRRTSTASTPSSARSSTAARWSTGSARPRPTGTTARCRTSSWSRSRSSEESAG